MKDKRDCSVLFLQNEVNKISEMFFLLLYSFESFLS